MKAIQYYIIIGLCGLLTALIWSGLNAEERRVTGTLQVDGVVQVIGNGKVDWTANQIRAMGIGVAPADATGGRARALAREAAIVIAERNLLKVVKGVHITSDTTVENLMLKSDVITEHVEGFLQQAIILQEAERADGSYAVVMAVALYGEDSLADSIDLDSRVQDLAGANQGAEPTLPETRTVRGNYTGLLVDCRGLKIAPAMSPKIVDEQGYTLYPRTDVSADYVIDRGMVGYYTAIETAKRTGRVGANPLIVRAVRAQGGTDFKFNPVLTRNDAAHILVENQRSKFLDNLAVGFLMD